MPVVHPELLHAYVQRGWFDEEAVAWVGQGIDVAEAMLWHTLGLTPPEAGRLARDGRMPADVIREWWSISIPFDEVACWIGAGLSAAEAVEQRAAGVTREQAAALRALRAGDPRPPTSAGGRAAHLAGHGSSSPGHQPYGPPGSGVPGPPPEDETATRQAVERAFEAMLEVDDDGAIAAVDGGANLGASLREASQRHGIREGSGTIVVGEVRFVNDHEARVVYSISLTGHLSGMSMLHNRLGRALLVDGTWKVARDTFCLVLQMARVESPPRPG